MCVALAYCCPHASGRIFWLTPPYSEEEGDPAELFRQHIEGGLITQLPELFLSDHTATENKRLIEHPGDLVLLPPGSKRWRPAGNIGSMRLVLDVLEVGFM